MRRMRPLGSILLLVFLCMALVITLESPRASAATMTLTVDEGMCTQVGTVPSGTGTWSMSASRPFEAVVTSSTGYSYRQIGSDHQDAATNSNYFLSGCNVCPGGPLEVTYQFPGSPDSNSPRSFPAQGYPADCGGAGLGGLGDIPLALQPVVGPLAFLAALAALVLAVALPVPRDPGSAQVGAPAILPPNPPPQPAPPVQTGTLVPTPWTYPLQPPQQTPPVMAGPGPRLQPTPWIQPVGQAAYHDVPADAPRQWPPPPQYPPGYPYPEGTYSKTVCPFCGFPTLSPFTTGWFCTNLQCPGRTSNTTKFVSMQWYSP